MKTRMGGTLFWALAMLMPIVPVAGAEVSSDGDRLPFISEFSAVNDTGFFTLVEGLETRSDWIEIHNPDRRSVNLDGWYLTDDPERPDLWQFPEVHLEPGGNLLIWASGIAAQDHPENWPYLDESGYYHTNFKLAGAGGYLALVSPEGQVIHEYVDNEIRKDSWGYPPQKEGVSYGPCSTQHMYLPQPTPGETNALVCINQCEDPVFSHVSSTFTGSFLLELSCSTPNAEIYYTLDGTEPLQVHGRRFTSARYTGPITMNKSAEVIARAFEPNSVPSSLVSQSYLALTPEVADFSSNLPIIVVDSGRKSVSGSFTLVKAAFINTDDSGRAHIAGPADFVGRGGMHVRGSSSSGFAKKQYAFEAWDLDQEDTDISIFGFPAESDWILYGPSQYDRGLISNALIYELSNQVGRYAVRTRFCEMYLNTNNDTIAANDYLGLYILMEKVARDAERVNVEKLEPWDSTEPRIAGGYILSIDRAGDGTFRTGRGSAFNYVYPKGEDITSKQTAWIRGYVTDLETALYGPNFRDTQTGYARYLDVDSFIDHHLLNLVPYNVDAFRLSGYMHKTREGKLELGPIWDYDRALNSTDGRDDRPEGWNPSGGTDFLTYFWWNRLFDDPNFWLRYIDRWFMFHNTVYSKENLTAVIDRMTDEIREAEARNSQRWPQYAPRYGSLDGEMDALKNWLDLRITWINDQFIQPPILVADTRQDLSNPLVTLHNPNTRGTLYYTLDGSDPQVLDNSTDSSTKTHMLVTESTPKRVLVPIRPISEAWTGLEPFDDSSWNSTRRGTGGVGYDMGTGYESLISLNLSSDMFDRSSSCYIRTAFVISGGIDAYNDLSLQIRYDDGFVAYLNGVEIARANFTGTPSFNAHADRAHDDTAAKELEPFNVTPFLDQLIEGRNILAIHGLNASAISDDFLISAHLVARELPERTTPLALQGTVEYTGPFTLTQSTLVRSRVFQSNHPYSDWGGLTEQIVQVGPPIAESLRISEIMYHPVDNGNPMDINAEYIELTNISDQPVNLNLVRFVEGIDFQFPTMELAPQAFILVVKDVDAFVATYDTTHAVVVGSYTGSLSNGGERLDLVDAGGELIQSIQYKDKWHTLTDGLGFSLTLIDPSATDVSDWSKKKLWRPSLQPGGSPGWRE